MKTCQVYQIIFDEEILKQFINDILPQAGPNEMFYVTLFARKKYCKEVKHVKSDKAQLKRFTSSKDRLLAKIKQLECPIDSYIQSGDGPPVPQESLALYINPNPRDLWKSTIRGIARLAELVEYDNRDANPHAEILSVIQATFSNKRFAHFDIDRPDGVDPNLFQADTLFTLRQVFPGQPSCYKVLVTRGGSHILVEPSKVPKEFEKTWYKALSGISETTGDAMLPVPGCCQGGFVPFFLDEKVL